MTSIEDINVGITYEGGSGSRKRVVDLIWDMSRHLRSATVTFVIVEPNPEVTFHYRMLPVGTVRTRHIGEFAKWAKIIVEE